MDFDHEKFFDGFKAAFDPTLEQSQVDGLEFLLSSFEKEPAWDDLRHIAYALATIAHETNFSFQPVEEGYYLAKYGQNRVKSFQKSLRYCPYFGRGYVQLTWLKNYKFAGKQLGLDLVNKPELALTPDVAFQVLTLGMHDGWFTTHKLSDYINADACDYVEARRIINGTDKAALIAGYARKFEKLLMFSTGAGGEVAIDQKPQPINIQNVENADLGGQPVVLPPEKTVEVKKESVGLWTKIVAASTAISGIGINAGSLIQQRLSELTQKQLVVILAGVALIALGAWIYHKAAQRASSRTAQLIDKAADPASYTVELKK